MDVNLGVNITDRTRNRENRITKIDGQDSTIIICWVRCNDYMINKNQNLIILNI